MRHPRLFPLLAVLLAATVSFAFLEADAALAWGWKEDDGAGAKRPQKRPANAEKRGGWNPTIVTAPPSGELEARKPETVPANVKAYCENIADQALDARFLAQKAELAHIEEELAQRTTLLEARKAEYQEWLKRRDEFIAKAEGSLVKLYSKMKPDNAAPQLAAMDEEAAAALLLKLSPKASSAILDQMETAKAARLASVIIGAAKPTDKTSAPERTPAQNAPGEPPPAASAAPPPDGRKS